MNLSTIIDTVEEKIGNGLKLIFDYGVDLAPYLGELNQTRKINRLKIRIDNHIDQLKQINNLFSNTTMSAEYIQERIGPIVLSDLIEEHEDAKIVYILNGFEHVFINENTNESQIINYFDTLRNLRYEDLRLLYFYAAITTDNPFESAKSPELIGLQRQIYFKLERLYLIKSAKTWGALKNGAETLNEDQRNVELTIYGLNFIKFISNDFDEKNYHDRISKYNIDKREQIQQFYFETN